MPVIFKFDVTKNDIKEILDLNVYFNEEILKSRQTAPGQDGLIIFPSQSDDQKQLRLCKASWGLRHPKQPNLKITHIDKSRIEKSFNFKDLLENKRSVLVCNEALVFNKSQFVDLRRTGDQNIIAVAVLYQYWPNESKFKFATLLDEKSPSSLLKRFPLILTNRDDIQKWLDVDTPIEEIIRILYQEANEEVFSEAVSSAMAR